MPFKSKKQRDWMKINKPEMYRKWKRKYGTKVQGGKSNGRKKSNRS